MMVTTTGGAPSDRTEVIEALRLAFNNLPDVLIRLDWTDQGWRVVEVRPWSPVPFPGSSVEDIEAALRAAGLAVADR
jgi:hypothetical protein